MPARAAVPSLLGCHRSPQFSISPPHMALRQAAPTGKMPLRRLGGREGRAGRRAPSAAAHRQPSAIVATGQAEGRSADAVPARSAARPLTGTASDATPRARRPSVSYVSADNR